MPEALAALQLAFAGHIRNPDAVPAPAGIEDRRLEIYRRLFFNNVRSLLASGFPVLRKLYGDAGWSRLVREFYAEHSARSPLFPELPGEFLAYLQTGRVVRAEDPGFLAELAHYEWVELALALDPREPEFIGCDPACDFESGIPVLSPLAWPLSYRYPVQRIGPAFRPAQPPPQATHLLAWRRRDYTVRFMELNDMTRLLLALMQEYPGWTGRQLLEQLASQTGHGDPARLAAHGLELLRNLAEREVVLGCRRPA